MKKIVYVLGISFIVFIVLGILSFSDLNYGVFETNYTFIDGETLKIKDETNLSLIPIENNNVKYHILGYDNKNLNIDENVSVSSVIIGKNCISITGSVLDVNTRLNKSIMSDLVSKLRNKLNGENSEIIVFNEDAPNPYIVSENEDYIFIDYITGVKNSKTSVVYYRIIIQNTKDLNVEISDDEYNSLPDYLPELLEVLGIKEVFSK